jgi:hypothetical protein
MTQTSKNAYVNDNSPIDSFNTKNQSPLKIRLSNKIHNH